MTKFIKRFLSTTFAARTPVEEGMLRITGGQPISWNSHSSEDLSELPLSGQEYQRWCCHRKTDRPRSAFWTVGPAPHLHCRIHADDLHRWIFALPPMSLPILCLYKAHQRMYFSFWIFTSEGSGKGCPFHYSADCHIAVTKKHQKHVKNFINIFSFDSIFLCL